MAQAVLLASRLAATGTAQADRNGRLRIRRRRVCQTYKGTSTTADARRAAPVEAGPSGSNVRRPAPHQATVPARLTFSAAAAPWLPALRSNPPNAAEAGKTAAQPA